MQQNRQLRDVLEQCKAIAEKAGVGIHLTAVSATGETASIVHTPGVDIDEEGVQVRTRLPRSDRAGDYATAAERERAMVATSAMVEQLEAVAAGTMAKLTAAETELRSCWKTLSRQTSDQQMNHGDLDHGLAVSSQDFIVFRMPSTIKKP